MAGIYAEQFAHLFDFSPLRTQTRIPPNPVLFSPYPVLLNGPLVKMQCVPLSYFFFSWSSKQILHQFCKMCRSLTFLGPVLKVKVLKSAGNHFCKTPWLKSHLFGHQRPCFRNWWVQGCTQIQPELWLSPLLLVLAKPSGKNTKTTGLLHCSHRYTTICQILGEDKKDSGFRANWIYQNLTQLWNPPVSISNSVPTVVPTPSPLRVSLCAPLKYFPLFIVVPEAMPHIHTSAL